MEMTHILKPNIGQNYYHLLKSNHQCEQILNVLNGHHKGYGC